MNRDDKGVLTVADPELVTDQADELTRVADNFDDLRRTIYDISVHGVWDSDAGRAFEDRLGNLPGELRAIGERFREAAELLTPYASDLRSTQGVLRRLVDEHDRTSEEHDRVRARYDASDPGSPEHASLGRRVDDLDRRLRGTERTFDRMVDDALQREQRLGDELGALADAWGDPRLYDIFQASSSVGDYAQSTPVGGLVPGSPLIGLPGDVGRRLVYREGSYAAIWETYRWRAADIAISKVRVASVAASKVPWLNDAAWVRSTRHAPRRGASVRIARTPPPTSTNSMTKTWRARVTDRAVTKVKGETGYDTVEGALDNWSKVVGTNKVAEAAGITYAVTSTSRKAHALTTKNAGRYESAQRVVGGQERDTTSEKATGRTMSKEQAARPATWAEIRRND